MNGCWMWHFSSSSSSASEYENATKGNFSHFIIACNIVIILALIMKFHIVIYCKSPLPTMPTTDTNNTTHLIKCKWIFIIFSCCGRGRAATRAGRLPAQVYSKSTRDKMWIFAHQTQIQIFLFLSHFALIHSAAQIDLEKSRPKPLTYLCVSSLLFGVYFCFHFNENSNGSVGKDRFE